MAEEETFKLLGGLIVQKLDVPLVLGNKIIPAGTNIVIYPVTDARAVMVGEDSLDDLWPSLSKYCGCG